MEIKKFTPYCNDVLPEGFNYPESYLKLSKNTDSINYDEEYLFPWAFENAEENINDEIDIYGSMTHSKGLLVFARNLDWAAFFNTYDKSGDPEVIVYDLGNLDTGEHKIKNFDEWLKMAENDAW